MKIILMRLRITIAMLEIRNRETLQSKVNICKSDVKVGDCADSLSIILINRLTNYFKESFFLIRSGLFQTANNPGGAGVL